MEATLIDIAVESYSKAVVLKSYLEANGIECYLKNVNILQGAVSEGVKVQIRDSDAEKALMLLTQKRHLEDSKKLGQLIRKILVPVDFSVPSQNAARFAVMLAAKLDAEVKLLHVFNSPVVDMIPFTDVASIQIDFDMNYNLLYRNAKDKLSQFYLNLAEFAKQTGAEKVPIGYTLREGYASYGIIETSKKYKPGIIIMGTKGEGYRSTELVGSVANEVSEQTRLPLLVIPEKAVLKGVNEVKNVLYATNFDETDFVSVRKLLRILSPFNIQLHLVHVSGNPESSVIKAQCRALLDYFSVISPNMLVEYSVMRDKDVARAFMDVIREKNISLVALTSIKRSILYKLFNPSLSKKMLYQSDVPVLLFHD